MERRPNSPQNLPQNLTEMFGGIPPSRGAAELARRAMSLGEDPTALTLKAGMAAQRDGRAKVGLFGQAERPLSDLRTVVESLEGRKAMARSSQRTNRR